MKNTKKKPVRKSKVKARRSVSLDDMYAVELAMKLVKIGIPRMKSQINDQSVETARMHKTISILSSRMGNLQNIIANQIRAENTLHEVEKNVYEMLEKINGNVLSVFKQQQDLQKNLTIIDNKLYLMKPIKKSPAPVKTSEIKPEPKKRSWIYQMLFGK